MAQARSFSPQSDAARNDRRRANGSTATGMDPNVRGGRDAPDARRRTASSASAMADVLSAPESVPPPQPATTVPAHPKAQASPPAPLPAALAQSRALDEASQHSGVASGAVPGRPRLMFNTAADDSAIKVSASSSDEEQEDQDGIAASESESDADCPPEPEPEPVRSAVNRVLPPRDRIASTIPARQMSLDFSEAVRASEKAPLLMASDTQNYELEGGDHIIKKRSWRIEHGSVAFTDLESNPREVLDFSSAASFEHAQQGKFLRIAGDETLAKPFTALKQLEERQERVEQLLEIVRIFEQEWGMSMPPMILGVTGNAAPFQLRPQYGDIFDKALLKATQATNAWVITGGTDSGVMRLVGNAMKTASTPVVGVASWGVIKGRGKLARPSTAKLAERITTKIKSKRILQADERPKDIGTEKVVLDNFRVSNAARWADPDECPSHVGKRICFLRDRGRASTLEQLELIDPDTRRPDIKRQYPEFSTGRLGRGFLGRWGPNQAIDTIVTRRVEQDVGSDGGATLQLQVRLTYREEDDMWAIPGKFTTNEQLKCLSSLPTGSRLFGQSDGGHENHGADDVVRYAVREVFELEAVSDGKAHDYKDVFEEVFKRSEQTLIYRGYSDDPRNTDEAWVETSVWHVHAPQELGHQLDHDDRHGVKWMNMKVTGSRLEFYDDEGESVELFASHAEFLEMAVFGHIQGSPDMPFAYDGKPSLEPGNKTEMVNLNPNHSHYICVDTGQDGQFGKEVAIRSELETFISIYDYDHLRNVAVAELTEHFTRTVDMAQIIVDGERVESGVTSGEIRLDAVETEIKIERIASDGDTRRTYTVNVSKTKQQAPARKENSAARDRALSNFHAVANFAAPGFKLNRSQDAGSTIFTPDGSDIASVDVSEGFLSPDFDPDVFEYRLEIAPTAEVIKVTPYLTSGRKQPVQVTVPVVTVAYGGGAVTLRTLEAISEDSAIVVIQGSERAAQFLEDWIAHEAEKDEIDQKDLKQREQIDKRQKDHAEKSIRSDFAKTQRPPTTYEHVYRQPQKPRWWDVQVYVDALGKLGQHKHLNFFRLDQTFSIDSSKEQRNNPLLPTLVTSILESERVKNGVKLPLAIRLNDKNGVQKLCVSEGIALRSDLAQEVTMDSRMLIYAAYHDQGKAVGALLDAGFDQSALDALIALEIQRALDMPRLVKEDEPPSWWARQQIAAGLDAARVESRWKKVDSHSRPGQAGKEDIYRSLTWDMMPSLPGWTFKVTFVAPNVLASQDMEEDGAESHPPPYQQGMILRQTSCRIKDYHWRGNDVVYERDFLILSPDELSGQKFKATDDSVANEVDSDGFSCSFQQGGYDWRATIVPLWKDNLTAWLPLDSECKFRFSARLDGRLEKQLVTESLFHWLRDDSVEHNRPQKEWKPGEWECDESCPHPNFEMHELHRLFWAIRSNRPKLAEVLMHRCHRPIVAGLFAAYVYKKQALPRNFVPDTQFKERHMPHNMRRSCELYACDILDNADFQGSYAAFDEFVYWGKDEEDDELFKRFKSLRKDRRDNANIRAALKLMHQDANTEPTNIDLALMANSKVFMGQPGVTQFLTKLWRLPSNNGKYTDALFSRFSAPRVKCYVSIIGYLIFLGIYVSFVLSMPSKSVELSLTFNEGVFWFWELASAMSEIGEAFGDFDSFHGYLRGSGNKLDFLIMVMFGLAFGARLWLAGATENVVPMTVMLGILCLNLILCFIRLLMMLSIKKSIGVMMIITKLIISRDVFPFLCFATIIIGAFEFAAFYFSWLRDVEHVGGFFFDMFTSLGDFQQLKVDSYDLPWWDREQTGWAMSSVFFEFIFFVITMVILMNLLIAMMTDTYSSIAKQANATYQMGFARLVNEYYEACVFPVPLSIIERAVDAYMGDTEVSTMATTGMHWGRHYTWPASQLQFRLDMARRKVQTKRETAKVLKKVKGKANKM
eukprot:COSAG02_NODE_360_length_23829_cov_107.112769_8_plen_1933_part_00